MLEKIGSQAELMFGWLPQEPVGCDFGIGGNVVDVFGIPLARMRRMAAIDDEAGELAGLQAQRFIHGVADGPASAGLPIRPRR